MKKHVVQFEIEVEDDEKIKDIKNVLKTLLECLEWETNGLTLDPQPKIKFVPEVNPDPFEDFKKGVPKPETPWGPYLPYTPKSPYKQPPINDPHSPKWYMGDTLFRKAEEFKAQLVALKKARATNEVYH